MVVVPEAVQRRILSCGLLLLGVLVVVVVVVVVVAVVVVVMVMVVVVGVGQLGMAHRSDGPASSLRMFGHVHRAMCSGGCQFEVLEEYACA